jgi:hypothetical protein
MKPPFTSNWMEGGADSGLLIRTALTGEIPASGFGIIVDFVRQVPLSVMKVTPMHSTPSFVQRSMHSDKDPAVNSFKSPPWESSPQVSIHFEPSLVVYIWPSFDGQSAVAAL